MIWQDEEQTPGWTGNGHPHTSPPSDGPDGICHGDRTGNTGKGCDCGQGVPCGEYLWDHRAGPGLTDWLVEEYIGGRRFGLGNENISGFFIDDNWGEIDDSWNHGLAPSEEAWPVSPRGTGANRTAGLSKQDLRHIQGNWSLNMAACQAKIVEMDSFNWQLLRGVHTPTNVTCSSAIRCV